MHAICQNQLNSGPSWCCAGHYPFTPICADYDVTVRPDNGRVFCGRAGRAYDQPNEAPRAPPIAANERNEEASCARGAGLGALVLAWLLLRRRKRQ
jgi:MYXO-CTERM domain-containing protein